jgi:glycosyltransferase involved in cell wall biosynthesis
LKYLDKAVTSLIAQTYGNMQIIVVVDGNQELQNRIEKEYLSIWRGKEIIVSGHSKNMGLSFSRNQGIKLADGDIIAFLDDDAVANSDWIEILVKSYSAEFMATGGKILPIWLTDKKDFLPEEFYWLIGATHLGFRNEAGEVNNTFGSNISFRREVFQKIGGFDTRMGKKMKSMAQGEETELSMRMRSEYGKGVYYNPEAIVYHHVFDYRIDFLTLLKRSFEQGRSRKFLEMVVKNKAHIMSGNNEYKGVIITGCLERIGNIIKLKTPARNLMQLICLVSFSSLIWIGYTLQPTHMHNIQA